jgi:2-haloacid dehalogenase
LGRHQLQYKPVVQKRKHSMPESGSVTSQVVFDLGGVLIDWNPRHLYRKIFGDDETAMEGFLAEVCSPEWNAQQDAGRSFAEAVAEREALYPQHAELIAAYFERWPEMLGGPIEESVSVLASLKQAQVPVFALTNWSRETFPFALERFDFLRWFDGIVVSGEEGLAKPDPQIYRVLTERYAVVPEQAVFIDDSAANVDAAHAMGMVGIHFQNDGQLHGQLHELGVAGLEAGR